MQVCTFSDCFRQKNYLSYRCPLQIPANEIIYDPEALAYFMRNMIFKGSNPVLARLMD